MTDGTRPRFCPACGRIYANLTGVKNHYHNQHGDPHTVETFPVVTDI